jgi:uncharacterized protein YjaG (DUF416 family)
MSATVESRWQEFRPRIESLSAEKQDILAIFSCARSARYYRKFCEWNPCHDPTVVPEILDSAWTSITVGRSDFKRLIPQLNERLKKTAIKLQEFDATLATAAQEACFACQVLLEILSGKRGAAQTMRVLNFTRDITDMIVQDQNGVAAEAKMLEDAILHNQTMVRELEYHDSALSILTKEPLGPNTVELLKKLAQR